MSNRIKNFLIVSAVGVPVALAMGALSYLAQVAFQ